MLCLGLMRESSFDIISFFLLLLKVLKQIYSKVQQLIPFMPVSFLRQNGNTKKTYTQKTFAKYKLLHDKRISKKFTSLGN